MNVTGSEGLEGDKSGVAGFLSGIQDKTAILPDYGSNIDKAVAPADSAATASAGKSMSGLLGSAIILAIALATGTAISFSKRRRRGGAQT
jgi:cobalt/nickel transport system permease protein